ncbi:papilin-like isoform X3 [Babesia caballi]|uniref:Papilin-like isoform X3 n=1 Tax=Babesia caballi TaxID=5871 RepID=A0AAV4LPR9_BABCB|nr:papilin-like isoform X3 [Babesia caballi]
MVRFYFGGTTVVAWMLIVHSSVWNATVMSAPVAKNTAATADQSRGSQSAKFSQVVNGAPSGCYFDANRQSNISQAPSKIGGMKRAVPQGPSATSNQATNTTKAVDYLADYKRWIIKLHNVQQKARLIYYSQEAILETLTKFDLDATADPVTASRKEDSGRLYELLAIIIPAYEAYKHVYNLLSSYDKYIRDAADVKLSAEGRQKTKKQMEGKKLEFESENYKELLDKIDDYERECITALNLVDVVLNNTSRGADQATEKETQQTTPTIAGKTLVGQSADMAVKTADNKSPINSKPTVTGILRGAPVTTANNPASTEGAASPTLPVAAAASPRSQEHVEQDTDTTASSAISEAPSTAVASGLTFPTAALPILAAVFIMAAM